MGLLCTVRNDSCALFFGWPSSCWRVNQQRLLKERQKLTVARVARLTLALGSEGWLGEPADEATTILCKKQQQLVKKQQRACCRHL